MAIFTLPDKLVMEVMKLLRIVYQPNVQSMHSDACMELVYRVMLNAIERLNASVSSNLLRKYNVHFVMSLNSTFRWIRRSDR